MWHFENLWKRFLCRQPRKRPYQKPKSKKLDVEPLEWRYGPTPTIDAALNSLGVSLANPLAWGNSDSGLLTSLDKPSVQPGKPAALAAASDLHPDAMPPIKLQLVNHDSSESGG